jgi:HlyD family secretion protein
MKTIPLIFLAALAATACQDRSGKADAFGNFEATEVIVSPETSGRILKFQAAEGTVIGKGDVVAVIDSTLLILQRAEMDAAIRSIRTKLSTTEAQNDVLNQQISNLDVNIGRIEKMLKDDAATKKQYDDLTGQAEVLRKQIAANNTQKNSIVSEISVYESRKATLQEQIRRCTVKSPISGTILEKYSEEGELTAAGKPLAKIADLTIIRLKVYVSGGQLGSVKLGQNCTVRIDEGNKKYRQFEGTVTKISDKAEFTPKIIQTKEERVTLVYAVTIDVRNDGSIKSGMPGESIFGTGKP